MIPTAPSGLLTIFCGHGDSHEPVTTFAVDAHAFGSAPGSKAVRIDIDALGGVPLRLDALLQLLGSFKPIFPEARHFVGVIEYPKQGRVILLPKPREPDDVRPQIRHCSALVAAIRRVGGARALAISLSITHQAVIQWRKCPPKRVLDVERISGISRHELRPDIYGPADAEKVA